MSRTYRKAETSLWLSTRFRGLSKPKPNGQTLWLYLLTGPRTAIIPGVVVARPAVMADDLGWSRRGFDKAMAEIVSAGMAEIDPEAGLVLLVHALIRNKNGERTARESAKPNSPNAMKAWITALLDLPSCSLRERLHATLFEFSLLCGGQIANAFAEATRTPLPTTSVRQEERRKDDEGNGVASQDQDQDQENKKKERPEAPPPLRLFQTPRQELKPQKPPTPTIPGFSETVALFTEQYRQLTGEKPTWGEKQGAQIKRLLHAHGADQVQSRIRRLFSGEVEWIRPPYDLGTLVQHFDKLAPVVRAPQSPRVPDEPARRIIR